MATTATTKATVRTISPTIDQKKTETINTDLREIENKVSSSTSKINEGINGVIDAQFNDARNADANMKLYGSTSNNALQAMTQSIESAAKRSAMIDAANDGLDLNTTQYTLYGKTYRNQALIATDQKIKTELATQLIEIENDPDNKNDPASYDASVNAYSEKVLETLPQELQPGYRNSLLVRKTQGQARVTGRYKKDLATEQAALAITTNDRLDQEGQEAAFTNNRAAMDLIRKDFINTQLGLLKTHAITEDAMAQNILVYDNQQTISYVKGNFTTISETTNIAQTQKYIDKFAAADGNGDQEKGAIHQGITYDTETRESLTAWMQSDLNKRISVQRAKSTKYKSQASKQLKDGIKLNYDGSTPSNDTYLTKLANSNEFKNTVEAQEYLFSKAIQPEMTTFRTTPTAQRKVYLDEEIKKYEASGTVFNKKRIDALKAEDARLKALEKSDVVQYTINNYSTITNPIKTARNFMSDDGSLDAAGFTNYAKEFKEEHPEMENYFTNQDRKVLSTALNNPNLSPGQRLGFIQQIYQGAGDKAIEMFTELNEKGGSVYAVAGSLLSFEGGQQKAVAVLEGERLLKEKVISVSANKFTKAYQTITNGANSWIKNPEGAAANQEAVKFAYAYEAQQAGLDPTETDIDDNVMKKAIATVYDGQQIEFNGAPIFSSEPGEEGGDNWLMPDAGFRKKINDLTIDNLPNSAPDGATGHIQTKEYMLDLIKDNPNIRLHKVGPKQYQVYQVDGGGNEVPLYQSDLTAEEYQQKKESEAKGFRVIKGSEKPENKKFFTITVN